MIQKLQIGFNLDVPEDEATAKAVERWRGVAVRAGRTPAGEPMTSIERSEGLERIGQYAVLVKGDVEPGADDGDE